MLATINGTLLFFFNFYNLLPFHNESPEPSNSELHDMLVLLLFKFFIGSIYRGWVWELGCPWQKLHFVLSDPFFVDSDVCFGSLS